MVSWLTSFSCSKHLHSVLFVAGVFSRCSLSYCCCWCFFTILSFVNCLRAFHLLPHGLSYAVFSRNLVIIWVQFLPILKIPEDSLPASLAFGKWYQVCRF